MYYHISCEKQALNKISFVCLAKFVQLPTLIFKRSNELKFKILSKIGSENSKRIPGYASLTKSAAQKITGRDMLPKRLVLRLAKASALVTFILLLFAVFFQWTSFTIISLSRIIHYYKPTL